MSTRTHRFGLAHPPAPMPTADADRRGTIEAPKEVGALAVAIRSGTDDPGDPPAITITLDGAEILRLRGQDLTISHLLVGDYVGAVTAVARALHLMTAHHPAPSPWVGAHHAVELMAVQRRVDPRKAEIAFERIHAAIVDASDAFMLTPEPAPQV